ncbi:hypothetical protein ACI78T_01335 [Blastococcus sp. SYSU D00922]
MSDSAGWARLAGGRPVRTSSSTLVLIWVAWLVLPPMLYVAGWTSLLFLLAGVLLAVGLPFSGLLMTWRSRRVAAGFFAAALAGVVLLIASSLPDGWYRDREGGMVDPGPSLCQQVTMGEGPCPDG